jgi:HTH-type transcriptional regulator / antitoxin HipB
MPYLLQTPAQLATHLRALRRAQGLTQSQLGRLVDLDQSRIAKIERNPSLVSVGQILKLLNALGVQVALQPQQPVRPPHTARAPRTAKDW